MDNETQLEIDCLNQMTKNGIPFKGPLIADGAIHRFSIDSKKNELDEWYSCHKGMYSHGKSYLICNYGSWGSGQPKFIYRSYENDIQISSEDRKILKQEESKRQKEIENQISKEREEKIKIARENWEKGINCADSNDHKAYLERKNVKPYGIRYGKDYYKNNVLIIPLKNCKDEVQGVQFIKGNGEKRIHGSKRGNYHLLGIVNDKSLIVVSEGYATAASIHEATDYPVFVAFDCGNYDSVIANIKQKYPKNQITIAGDDDVETKDNPGRVKAEEASKKYECNVIFPKFPKGFKLPNGKSPTDFNDIHVHFGFDELKKQLNRKKSYLSPIDIGRFLSLNIPPRNLILSPWLPEQGLTMLYAKRGIGKTFVALSVAYAVACGGTVLKWKAERPRKVLYIDGEMPMATMQERLASIALASDKQPPDSSYFKLITPDLHELGIRDLSTSEGQMDINEHLEDVDLIIIDNLSTLVRSGRENESESWLPIQEWALALRRAGKSVLFVHHAGKGGQQRGTSRKEDVLDTVITLKSPKDFSPKDGAKFEIHFEKSRGFEGEEASPFEASLIADQNGKLEWSIKGVADRDFEKAIEFYKDNLSMSEIAQELGVNKSTISRWIKAAKEDGR